MYEIESTKKKYENKRENKMMFQTETINSMKAN